MEKPDPFHTNTWERAEENAARWIRYWGYPDARVTASGPDGGIDVEGEGVIAQVKYKGHDVGLAEVQRLAGIGRSRPDAELIFFSGSSFTVQAIGFASRVEMALFTFDPGGNVYPANEAAELVTFGVLAPEFEDVVDARSRFEPRPAANTFGPGAFNRFADDKGPPPEWIVRMGGTLFWLGVAFIPTLIGCTTTWFTFAGTQRSPSLLEMIFSPASEGPSPDRVVSTAVIFLMIAAAAFAVAFFPLRFAYQAATGRRPPK